jgi:hypothetical protein
MNNLTPELIAQLYAQESGDPFLSLITMEHPDFAEPIRLVNNSVNIISRGETFLAFPMKIRLPVDDGESAREFQIDLDNVSLELVTSIRSVTTQIGLKIEMILASLPDEVQISIDELKIQSITYDKLRVTARVVLDNFLNTEMTSERYGPKNFPGLF